MTEMERALQADGEKLLALTGKDHGPFCPDCLGQGWTMVGDIDPQQTHCQTCSGTGKPQPAPCCMWCGGEKPEAGWHFYQYPQALCSEKCSTLFKAAI